MEQPLSDTERDVLTLASIANPLPLDVVKAVIGIDDASTSDIVDRLGASGQLDVERRGLTAADPGAPQARRSMLATRLLQELDARNAPAALTAPAAWAAGLSGRAFTDYRAAIADSNADASMLVDRAIEAGEESGADEGEIAGLRVLRARSRRNRGQSLEAMADLEAAFGHLEGAALVDALAFAGTVEDDMQHPADAERYVAAIERFARPQLGKLRCSTRFLFFVHPGLKSSAAASARSVSRNPRVLAPPKSASVRRARCMLA